MLVNIQDLSHMFLDLCSTREDILLRPLVGKSGDTAQQCEERERERYGNNAQVVFGQDRNRRAASCGDFTSAERYGDLPLRQHSDSWPPSHYGPDRRYENKG